MSPKTSKIIGWVLAGLMTAFQLMSAMGKLFATEGTEMATMLAAMGWWDKHIALGILSVTCGIVFIIPRTAVFGTILMAGYWGGAMATELGHGALQPIMALPIILIIGSAWFRTPELFERVLGKR